ncbi:MAG TPA: YihA family ribosome biogenesis GTP-binding protein [Aquifex aeolicus]|uniref:Probable GTP-binding protein EngB n=1 Tax=Aquifex aeolicus TaxID=63363 RepID=A0A9D1CFH8_AQUAO|nr:YihA family ribosome biogenesis GTP-binding protein [Aquificales bacterium]HIP98905.1 YihA family ribosome biogenesis GTP-binding protein [Aquifex aeolicus]HIQ26507.1 YihA family ribosome biogenesis GTP-binding protein [Aquifex aeolicus]
MKVEFVKSVYRLEDLPKTNEPRREVVFVGRSNVGKSSLLNMLVGRNIARVGRTPGRTRSINYFRWDFEGLKAFLVDLPGYGFAKGDRKEIENWKKLIEGYFRLKAGDIGLVLVLIDAKVGPTEDDKALLSWLKYLNVPFEVVLTKTDKATQKELAQTKKKLKALGINPAVRTSAKEGQGKEKLLKVIAQALRGG